MRLKKTCIAQSRCFCGMTRRSIGHEVKKPHCSINCQVSYKNECRPNENFWKRLVWFSLVSDKIPVHRLKIFPRKLIKNLRHLISRQILSSCYFPAVLCSCLNCLGFRIFSKHLRVLVDKTSLKSHFFIKHSCSCLSKWKQCCFSCQKSSQNFPWVPFQQLFR